MEGSTITQAVRTRILEAADQLYADNGRQKAPGVDAVRRRAQTDMHAAVEVMREWRRQLNSPAAPVAVPVPDKVVSAHNAALATIWQQAVDHAGDSFRTAQIAWEAERAESDALRAEIAEAHKLQGEELEAARAERDSAVTAQKAAAEHAVQDIAKLRDELGHAMMRAERAEAKAEEAEHRIRDLRGELDIAHEFGQAQVARISAAQVELAEAQKGEARVREELAAMTGRFDATRALQAELMAKLTPHK